MLLLKTVKNSFYAYAMLTGTIIGVGIFSLPYITSRAGLLTVAAYFIFLGAVAMLIHIFWGEITIKTPGHHRLPGMARIYLGSFWGRVATVTAIGSLLGAILAYVILGADFSNSLFNGYLGEGEWLHVILYCLIGAFLIWKGDKLIAKLEVWGIIALALIFAVLIWKVSGHWRLENILTLSGQAKNFFLPYGVVLFSLWGASAIPDVQDVMGRDKRRINKIIVAAGLSAMIVYAIFITIILGVSGAGVDPTALGGLTGIVGADIEKILLALGILTTFTSYITLALALNKLLIYDLKISPMTALVTVAGVPTILYFLGVNNFITIISFVGSVMLAIDGIFIAAIYGRLGQASRLRRLGILAMMFCFALGIVYEFYKII
ncbi:MAG TPA: aromatic amino acid transport family protein [Patescibacteria group bacterium]|nr:aromatic amino acid transport family protein [Patescibacteria group bacterium]